MRTLDLQRIRKDFNVTQKALADMLNINQSFLSNIENGRSPLPYDKRQKILEVFNITRPEEYTIESPEPYSIKNVQRSFLGSNKFMNNSSAESPSIVNEVRKMLEMYLGANSEQGNISSLLADQLDKSCKRISMLEARNEVLYEKNDALRARLAELHDEVLTLRRILSDNGINYDKKSDLQKSCKSQSDNL